MNDEKRGPAAPDDDPDRTEIQREDPFGDLSSRDEKTLDTERTLAADEALGQDADATMALDEDATMAAPDHVPLGDLPANLPATIGKYQVMGKLGEGGMGVVLEAEQQNPKRRVALKVIRGGQFVDDDQIRMFKREADTLALLKHANIGAIYESGHTEGGRHFFAMELVRGKDLDDYLQDRPETLDSKELKHRLELFRKIADAVHYAHQRGVIHRDLKPSNIVVPDLEEDEDSVSGTGIPEIKILDFGLARITEGDMAAATMQSEVGLIKGTLPYMSPEQARGMPEEIDLRTDVYALGVILYEMLVGERPYDTQQTSLIEAVRVIHEEPPKPLRQAWTGRGKVDEDLETIVGKSLEKAADDRYGSAAALSEDIGRYLTSQPILARPPSTIYQLRKLVARNRLGTAFAATVLLLVIGFGIWMSYLYRQSEEARHQSEIARLRAEASNVLSLARIQSDIPPSAAIAYARASLELTDSPAARRFALEALLHGPTAQVAAAAPSMASTFSPDGESLALGTHDFASDKSGLAFQSSTGAMKYLGLGTLPPAFIGFDEHAERVYEIRLETTALASWSLPEGDPLVPPDFGIAHGFVQPRDRRFLVTLEQEDENWAVVRKWSTETHELVSERRIPGRHAGTFVARIDVDPSAANLAFIHDGQVFVANLASQENQPPRMVGFHETAKVPIFHPTKPIVVSASYDPAELRFWSLAEDSDGPIRTLGIEPFTFLPRFDPTGRYLAAGSGDGGSWVWDLEAPPDAGPVSLVRSNADNVMSTSFHPHDPWLVTADQGARTFWSLDAPWPFDLRGHEGRLGDLVFDPEGRWLVSSAPHVNVALLWPLEGSQGVKVLDMWGGRSVAVDPMGERLAVLHDADDVHLITLEGEEIAELGQGDLWEVAFSGDGRYVATSGGQFEVEDAVVKVWDLEKDEEIVLDAGDGAFVLGVIFLSDNRVVASGDSGVRIWSLEARDFVKVMEGPTGSLEATSDDRRLVVLTGEDTEMRHGGKLVVHDLESGQTRELTTHGDKVNALAVDPSGTKVATGDNFGVVRFGNINGEEPHLLLGQSARIEAVAIDPNGRWIASGDAAGLVRLWPIPEGQPLHTLPLDEFLSRLENATNYRVVADAQAPDGYRLEIGPFDGW